jgi:hypothetical protein
MTLYIGGIGFFLALGASTILALKIKSSERDLNILFAALALGMFIIAGAGIMSIFIDGLSYTQAGISTVVAACIAPWPLYIRVFIPPMRSEPDEP